MKSQTISSINIPVYFSKNLTSFSTWATPSSLILPPFECTIEHECGFLTLVIYFSYSSIPELVSKNDILFVIT